MLTLVLMAKKTWVYAFVILLAFPTRMLTHGHQLAPATQIIYVFSGQEKKKRQEEERGPQLIPIIFIKKVNGFPETYAAYFPGNLIGMK